MFTGGISALTTSLLGSAVSGKREDLRKLREALVKLEKKKSDFSNNRVFTEKPELAPSNWHGRHASQFEEIRSNGVVLDYENLYKKQFMLMNQIRKAT